MMRLKLYPLICLLVLIVPLEAQSLIKGKISDAITGEPLIGATALIKTVMEGATTDLNGEFEIQYSGAYPVSIQFSYVGYETIEQKLLNNDYVKIGLMPGAELTEVTVTARRRNEELQDVPIPIAVIGSAQIDNALAFNVNRVKELVPSVQLYSSNPRNTTLNIRGLGSTFGLTNDGIDPGVGFYVDGVYYARPAATTLDFIDIQQIEVLRGPQGTLFGKNTTAGTFNITSRKPTFTTSGVFEQSFGNYGFIQTKGSFSGPLIPNVLAARISFSGTHRDGTIYNIATDEYVNTLSNQGVRGQLLYEPNEKVALTLIGDYNRQRPNGFAQVIAGVAPTQRAGYRQFDSIIADLGYTLPTLDPFERIIDHDTPWRSDQEMGGVSLNADVEIGKGTLTSTTAWRTWIWGPSNDRDFTGLQALAKSEAPSIHQQFSQEVRYAGDISEHISGVVGVFAFYQMLDPDSAHVEESGADQWRFVQSSTSDLWATPGLFDGFGIRTYPRFRNFSGAVFGQIDWQVSERLSLLPGIRMNYDQKEVDFKRETYGGLDTDDPDLLALLSKVYTDQEFVADIDDINFSGQFTITYALASKVRGFATYSLGFKPVGLNLGGLPTQDGEPLIELAVVKPEQVNHVEIGFKSEPTKNLIANITVFNTDILNYQTNVQVSDLGVNRGYLANAEHVRVSGAELELNGRTDHLQFNGSLSYTDGKYVKFTNAPVSLEETGGELPNKDISGEVLPGVSKWAGAAGAEGFNDGQFIGQKGEYFIGADVYFRSGFSSSPTPSEYLQVDGYSLINARVGFRANKGISVFLWSRNIADAEYFEMLLPGAGNSGQYAGALGDPRTYGVTMRYTFF